MDKQKSGSDIVRAFLIAMEQRDLKLASSYLADGFSMTFPGGAKFHKLEELVSWAGDRYQTVGKTYERFDECAVGDELIVYCYGYLHGIWLDGNSFEGIRFIDRFTIRGGLIFDQLVWNDLAETRALMDKR